MNNQDDKILRDLIKADFQKSIENDCFAEEVMFKINEQKTIASQPLISTFWMVSVIFSVLLLVIISSFVLPESDSSIISNIKINLKTIINYVLSQSMLLLGIFVGVFFISFDFILRKRKIGLH